MPRLDVSSSLEEEASGLVRWTPTLRAHVYPNRRRPAMVTTGFDAQKLWSELRGNERWYKPDLALTSKQLQAPLQACLGRAKAKRPPGRGAPLVEACHMMLNDNQSLRWLQYWLATGGVLHAMRCQLEAMRLAQHHSRDDNTFGLRLQRKKDWGWQGNFYSQDLMRKVLSACPQAEWEATGQLVAAALPGMGARARQDFIAFFPECPEWVDRWIEALPREPDADRSYAGLLSCAGTAERGQRLIRAIEPRFRPEDAATFLADVGAGAVPVLVAGLDRVLKYKNSWPDHALFCQLLGATGSLPAVDALARHARDKIALAGLKASLRNWPALALKVLTKRLGKEAEDIVLQGTYRSLLASLLQQEGARLDEAIAALPPAQRQRVEDMRHPASQGPEAEPGEMPALLMAPPWRSPASDAPAAPSPPLKLRAPPKARLAWPPSLAASWAYPTRIQPLEELWYLRGGADCFTPRITSLCKKLVQGGSLNTVELEDFLQGTWFWSPSLFIALPQAVALALWNDPRVPYQLRDRRSREEYAFVARFGLAALPGVLKICAAHGELGLNLLRPFAAPQAASWVASVFATSKRHREAASDWLTSHAEAAVDGLLSPALDMLDNAPRQHARQALSFLAAQGHTALIQARSARHGETVAAAVEPLLSMDLLRQHPAKLPALPSFLMLQQLPRPRLKGSGKALPVAAIKTLCEMLSFSTADAPYAGLAAVREACEPASLAGFAWGLYEAWLEAGAPMSNVWAFIALGLLGDDHSVRRLLPLIRQWPGQNAHARAVLGLQVLALIGTELALTSLHGLAQKLKFKALQAKARDHIERLARARGLTADELADRLVPDLGLDAQGAMPLDFGPRAFHAVLDDNLVPELRDAGGARLANLPKPRASDDADKARSAVLRFQTLKKDARLLAAQQVLRLELAMCNERRWPQAVFHTFIVGHPLVRRLAQRLLWNAHDARGAWQACFRVAEDGTLADLHDNGFTLSADSQVSLVHALTLSEPDRVAFTHLFADYELIPPFSQIDRTHHRLSKAERASARLDRWQGLTVDSGRIMALERCGWRRGPVGDGGGVDQMVKDIGRGLQVSLEMYPGLTMGLPGDAREQTLRGLSLQGADRFDAVPGVVASECVRDVEGLR